MRHAWIGALLLGLLPAAASAGHHDGGGWSVGVGFGYGGVSFGAGYGYPGYYGSVGYGYAPHACYGPSYYAPAPIYVAPPVVYRAPVYVAPPVVYGAPVVRYAPGPYYYGRAGYYHHGW